jgi:hypothetical protein
MNNLTHKINMNHFNKLFLAGLFFLAVSCNQVSEKNTTYFFDAASGSDLNSGTSASHPFQSFEKILHLNLKPGDSILLKSGAIFTEKLYLSAKGSPEKPIVIGKYGGEVKPHLKGDATKREMVHIYNSGHLIIRDLEISNRGNKPMPNLNGLYVELDNYGVAKNITVDNLFIHDIFGSLFKGDGYQHEEVGAGQAILLESLKSGEQDSIPSCFDGLLIQNCLIKDCQRNGIMMWGNWIRKHWFPSRNVVIRNNVLDGVPGDGIVPVGCESPLVEYNVMKNCPDLLPDSEACDGIWPWSCDNAVIQYNIVSNHHSKVDGYGFDSDYNCRNSLFQYNISYNNTGGFLLICNSGGWTEDWSAGNVGTIIRYNLSINDGLRDYLMEKGHKPYFSPVIHITGPVKNTIIEKNLFYVLKKQTPEIDKTIVNLTNWKGYADSSFFASNFLFVEEPNLAVETTLSTHNFYHGNVFVGPLSVPSGGFKKSEDKFNQSLWFQKEDTNWVNLVRFIGNKTVPINGELIPITKILGIEN